MQLFAQFRPLLRIAAQLERIANALEFFALHQARKDVTMYVTKKSRLVGKDESELLHTDSLKVLAEREEDFQRFLQHGLKEDEQDG